MRKLISLAVTMLFISQMITGQINFPGGRIAYSADGNQHDHDDFAATAMSLALFKAAGLGKSVVHYDFSNHLGDNNVKMDSQMVVSAIGGAVRFGFKTKHFFNCQTQLDAAIKNFRKEGNKSSADNPLWYICAGPMEVAWRCVSAVKPEKRKYIYVISHSQWNNNHHDTPEMTHTWDDMPALGVNVIDIKDQNPGTNRPYEEYHWLRDSEVDDYNWLWERGVATGKKKFDPSDAGMSYYLITGGPKGGDEDCTPEKFRVMLKSLNK